MRWHPGVGRRLTAAVKAAGPRLDAIRARVGFGGPLTRSQLFVSDAGARSPLHFDQYDNVFCQLRGRKRVWLAPPENLARPAATYPVHHPLDAYARRDEAAVDGADAVVLEAGDALVIPSHWWHAVQTLDDDTVSLNFWFSIRSHFFAQIPQGTALQGDHLRAELARQVEYLAADVLGPDAVGGFLARLHADLAPENARADHDDDLPVRNYVAHQLAARLGADNVAAFCATYLDAGRARGLPLLQRQQ